MACLRSLVLTSVTRRILPVESPPKADGLSMTLIEREKSDTSRKSGAEPDRARA